VSDSELRDGERYYLRGCLPGGVAYGGFIWPLAVGAVVTAPDWDPTPECGHGLHGNLDGGGNSAALVSEGPGVVVAARDAVDLGGKHKFPTCRIVYVGESLQDAATWLARRIHTPVHYGTSTAGDHGTATAGDHGTATAGDHGTATAGYCGTAAAGDYGTATAGYQGTATAGDGGTATAGYCGTAAAGAGGCVVIRHVDGTSRYKLIGRSGAGRKWRLNTDGEFEVTP